MNPQEILTYARQRYNAVGDNFYSDAELLDGLYFASMDIALKIAPIERIYTTSSVIGQREYDKPTNTIRIKRITYNGKRLDPIDFVEDDLETANSENTTSTGVPKFYTEFAERIFLRPVPSEVKDIKIYSINEPSRLTITSTLEVPTRYHILMVDYLLSVMFAKDKNHVMSKLHLDNWEKGLKAALAADFLNKFGDKYPVVKDVDVVPYHDIRLF